MGFLARISGFVAAILTGKPARRNALWFWHDFGRRFHWTSGERPALGDAHDQKSGGVMSRVSLATIVFAALVSAVPSKAALFPTRAASDLAEDDLTGSGLEPDSEARSVAGAEREESLEVKVARQWREMAKRARRQADLLGGPQRKILLDRAAEYEIRAKRIEDGGARSD
jgi:hypothetical protein